MLYVSVKINIHGQIRHLHTNFKKHGYKGKAYKDALWGAARATNVLQFKHYMSIIRGMSEDVFDYTSKIDPQTWSRHAFTKYSCSDILINNTAECFNAWILEARDKPVLGCMELEENSLYPPEVSKSSNLNPPLIFSVKLDENL
jgi:hypothetical protein